MKIVQGINKTVRNYLSEFIWYAYDAKIEV
jgi:hypothetical protein